MSRSAGLGDCYNERDFVISSTEEFVKKFGGTRCINKVSMNRGQKHTVSRDQ